MSCEPVATEEDACVFGVRSSAHASSLLAVHWDPWCITHERKAIECECRHRAERDRLRVENNRLNVELNERAKCALLPDALKLQDEEVVRLHAEVKRLDGAQFGLRQDLSDAVEEADGLREALQLVASRMGTGDACRDYEDRAEEFRRATGLMAPGKSQPACMPDNDEERRARWETWAHDRNQELRRIVTAALKTAPKAEEKK